MKFLSICSGIEAASVAWAPLGWSAVALAEIERFPSAVLAHHYPGVPNLGDLTRFAEWPEDLLAEVELVAGGTPCQAFSLAGKRESLADARGNLTLIYVQLIDRIDRLRARRGRPPVVCLWENVPGVLSTGDNAFGCFLAALAGECVPLTPPGGRWTDVGHVRGPARAIAWRLLDAQYFGVAQRRERVFAVAGAGDLRPEEILFEREGVRRDSPPRRETGEGTAGTLTARAGNGSRPAGGNGNLIAKPILAGGHSNNPLDENLIPDIAPAVTAKWAKGSGGPSGDECQNLVCQDIAPPVTRNPHADNLSREGLLVPVAYQTSGNCGAWETGDVTGALDTFTDPNSHVVAFSGRARGDDGRGYDRPPQVFGEDVVGALDTVKPHCVAFDTTQITSAENRSNPQPGDPFPPLAAGAHAPAVVFQPRIGRNGRGYSEGAVPALGGADAGATSDMRPCVATASAVRRLTPRECERLQGFPDDYTLAPYRGQPAADGPRYKALGNSWAVPCARWIGERIASALSPS